MDFKCRSVCLDLIFTTVLIGVISPILQMEKLRAKGQLTQDHKAPGVAVSRFQFLSVGVQRLCFERLILRQEVFPKTPSHLSPCGASVIAILRHCCGSRDSRLATPSWRLHRPAAFSSSGCLLAKQSVRPYPRPTGSKCAL